jgi:hypothetical protein
MQIFCTAFEATQTETGSAVSVPALQSGLGIDRVALDVDLEVEVAAAGAGVAGLADGADSLAGPDIVAAVDSGRSDQVGVEVAALLAQAVDQQVVAVEDRVIADPQHPAGRRGDQGRTTGGDDVESFVDATTAARRAEFADGAARPVRAVNREDVGVERRRAVESGDRGRGRRDKRGEKNEGEKERTLQWCSMTRSTMLYSFASSALIK